MKKILFLFYVTTFVFGQKTENLDSLFSDLYNQKKFNGNVLIVENNKIIFQKSFGLANEKTNEKLNSNSIFELASVSKQYTAMGIVILKEQGKLNYDDKIGKFIPELSFYSEISIRNLLNHTSGLPDYMNLLDSLLMNDSWKKNIKIATNKDIIQIFAKHQPKVLFEPNEKWEYSNTGYALLASIIESASGATYAEYLEKNIFKPLKMKNTFVYTRRFSPKNIKNYAFGYVSDSLHEKILPDEVSKNGLNQYVLSMDGIVGDGTVNSTTNDLFIWDRSLYSNKLVSQESLDEIFKSSKLNDNSETDYGFGWQIINDKLAGKVVKHSGSWPGYKSLIERHIDKKNTIIVLMNNDNKKIKNPIKDVNKILYNIKTIRLTDAERAMIAGEYKTTDGKIKKILSENNTLFIPFSEKDKLELEPISKTQFRVLGFMPEVLYDFVIVDNKVEKYIVTQAAQGIKKEAVKIN